MRLLYKIHQWWHYEDDDGIMQFVISKAEFERLKEGK